MSPLLVIVIGIVLVLSVFLILPFVFRPKYSVVMRLGAVQLSNNLSSIRISSVILKRAGKNNQYEKGLFILGARKLSIKSGVGNNGTTDYSEEFPISDQDIDKVITLLKTQEVFSVTWQGKKPIEFSVDVSSRSIKLVVKRSVLIDYGFIATLEDRDVAKILSVFEALKGETASTLIAQHS